LKNIDEEKLYTKHIFDRFDLHALLMAVVRGGSYIAMIITLAYLFKRFQNDFFRRRGKFSHFSFHIHIHDLFFKIDRKAVHDKLGWEMFYRIWYCVIISQITFCGIIVEIIWSYNQYNFFFWLQIYSGYSVYTCLCAILHNKYEKYIPIVILVISILLSRLLHWLVLLVYSGLTLLESIQSVTTDLPNKIKDAHPD